MKKILFFLASVVKLIGQLLSIVLTTAYVGVLVLFSATLILPKYFQQEQIYKFIENLISKTAASELTPFIYNGDFTITFIIILVILTILIGLFLCRVRLPLIITGIPNLIIGIILMNLGFFNGMISNLLKPDQLLVFEDIRNNLFNDAKNLGIYLSIIGGVFVAIGIYLSLKNQVKIDESNKPIKEEPKEITKKQKEIIVIDSKSDEEIKSNLYCPECGSEYDVDAIYCINCGTKKTL